jgi:hypothetical protein
MSFPVAAHGYQEVVGFDRELHPDEAATAAYGTVIDPVTRFLRMRTFGLDPGDMPLPRGTPNGAPVARYFGATGGVPREMKLAPDIRGGLEWLLDPSHTPLLIMNAMGSYGDTTISPLLYTAVGVGDPGTHTFRMPAVPRAPSHALTFQRQVPARKSLTFGGCYFESLEISGEHGSPIVCAGDIIAQNYQYGITPDTVSYETGDDGAVYRIHEAKLYYHATPGTAGPLTGAGGAGGESLTNIRTFSLSFTNPLRAESASGVEDSSGNASSGRGIRRPVLEDDRTVSLRITTDYDSDFYQDMLRTLGAGAFITLELYVNLDFAANERSFRFRMPAANIAGDAQLYAGGQGPEPEEIVFEAAAYDNAGTLEIFEMICLNQYLAATPYSPTAGW